MNAIQDTRDNYMPIDLFVLKRAGINPYECSFSLDEAIEKKLPGHWLAKGYKRELLKDFFYSDKSDVDELGTRIISPDPFDFDCFEIRQDFASEWQPKHEDRKKSENPHQKMTTATPIIKEKRLPRSMRKSVGMMLKKMITHGSLEFPQKGNIDDRGMGASFVSMIQDLQYELGQSSDYISRPSLYRCFDEAINALDPDNTDQ